MPDFNRSFSFEDDKNQMNSALANCFELSEDFQEPSADRLPFIQTKEVSFSYFFDHEHKPEKAIENISLDVASGQHIAILGRNGSGKSTLAKLINGLLLPDHGEILVLGKHTTDDAEIWSIRQNCGMVFQNPDNQIVGTTVEEDVAFGPENIGVPQKEIRQRVDQALSEVGLKNYAMQAPSQLSGGQKQKLAIAGILAMKPQCIILDEATSMLDPQAAQDLMQLIATLKDEYHLTVLDITHDVENAILADYIYVLQKGQILMQGTPRQIFCRPDKILAAGLELPKHLLTLYSLLNDYPVKTLELFKRKFPNGLFTIEETVQALKFLKTQPLNSSMLKKGEKTKNEKHQKSSEKAKTIISVENVSFSYQKGTKHEVQALRNINFSIRQGELVSIIGHSGSGKSTLISHLNALTLPQSGQVFIDNLSTDEKKNIPQIRKRVGLLFQYPEHQLFESTVYDDIAFGPKQFKMPAEEMEHNIKEAIKIVNLDKDILNRSPFELSGGQQRRVAIAGVIAMNCDIYVLDEPAAGLDPLGKNEIFSYISTLRKIGKTIILVSHDMNLAAEISDRIMVLKNGEIQAFTTSEKIFSDSQLLEESGLDVPAVYRFSNILSDTFHCNVTGFSVDEVKEKLLTNVLRKTELPKVENDNME